VKLLCRKCEHTLSEVLGRSTTQSASAPIVRKGISASPSIVNVEIVFCGSSAIQDLSAIGEPERQGRKKGNPTARSTLPSPIKSTTARKGSNFSKTILKVEEGQRPTTDRRRNEKGIFPIRRKKSPFRSEPMTGQNLHQPKLNPPPTVSPSKKNSKQV